MAFYGLLIPLCFFILVSILGYACYKGNTDPIFLLTLDTKHTGRIVYSVLYSFFLFIIMLSFPIYFYQGRDIFLHFIDACSGLVKMFTRHEKIEKDKPLRRI